MRSLNTPLGDGRLSLQFRERGCHTLGDASRLLTVMPYGRPTMCGIDGVLMEGRGTCSSKHALFVALCREVGIRAELVIGFFLMTEANVPGVHAVLAAANLEGILEAHCIAQLPDGRLDITGLPSGEGKIELQDFIEIEPEAVAVKAELHRNSLGRWAAASNIPLSMDELWSIRERCIAALS